MITIVLAAPEIPANVGFIARNMACHGLTDLRIVGRPGTALHPDAIRTASGQEAILQEARDFADMDAAVSDCTYALGFSRRARDPGQRILDLPEAAAHFLPFASPDPASGRMALVFGRESQGMSREEAFRCSHMVRIPLPGPMLSLNLSHAVAIALYAFFGGAPGGADLGKAQAEAIREGAAKSIPGKSPAGKSIPGESKAGKSETDMSSQAIQEWAAQSSPERVPAASPISEGPAGEVLPLAETEKILSAVIARLQERGQLRPAKAEAQVEYLRILWQRLQPTRREVEFLAGLLKKLAT